MLKYIALGLGLGGAFVLLISAKRKPRLERNGKGVARFLMNLGYSKSNASGIAGNLYTESKYDPQALGDNGTSFGLAQWHKSRWDALKSWCNERNLDINSFEVQLRFIDWELNNTEKRAKRELLSTNTPSDSAFAFAKYYERPQRIVEERMNKAKEIYNSI
jgi:hypothetical protein|tara:strand:+ start:4330 stop:4812 length:483 start_codon:yes stop_codon:yes gene_type:complete